MDPAPGLKCLPVAPVCCKESIANRGQQLGWFDFFNTQALVHLCLGS